MSRATRLVPLAAFVLAVVTIWITIHALMSAGVRSDHLRHVPVPRLSRATAEPPGTEVADFLVAGGGRAVARLDRRVSALLSVGNVIASISFRNAAVSKTSL